MKITKTPLATVVKPEKRNIAGIFTDFVKIYDDLVSDNIILDLSSFNNVNNENLSVFLTLIEKHKKNDKSFVLVVDEAELDALSEELSAAPTLTEAKDLVEMENIERDLGF